VPENPLGAGAIGGARHAGAWHIRGLEQGAVGGEKRGQRGFRDPISTGKNNGCQKNYRPRMDGLVPQ